MPQNCCVPGCKKKVYEEDGVKISSHKFPEDRGFAQDTLNREIISHYLQAVKKG